MLTEKRSYVKLNTVQYLHCFKFVKGFVHSSFICFVVLMCTLSHCRSWLPQVNLLDIPTVNQWTKASWNPGYLIGVDQPLVWQIDQAHSLHLIHSFKWKWMETILWKWFLTPSNAIRAWAHREIEQDEDPRQTISSK